ncbi:GNAT family N-acetyltransferase [Shewanella kaireitica]|uniref:GNAT family N-acetyltransferase n=1 Tax=Shewanella kaireitica TaxID=212021 RepID=UPI00200E5060|nr:GNAT family N-acetyltransferase [Shewanella kaireitica]MCL1095016.1 GNAT family N-acetyltransferase [Shewanella kaireitica]
MTDHRYTLIEQVATAEDFVRLRIITGLTPRPLEAAKKALPNSVYGVHICVAEQTIAMGRVVGDGALNFDIVDVAVDPHYQGQGFGRLIMQSIMDYLENTAFKGAYITLMADVPELYTKFGFKLSRPASEGMYIIK